MSELKTSNPYTLTTEQYQELYKEVLLFAQVGGVTNNENNLWKMCEEEFIDELIPATEAEDKIQVIDAVADSFVVFSQLHHYYLSKPSWEQPLYDDTGWEYAPFYLLEEMILKRREKLVPSCMSCWLEVAELCAKEYNFNLYKAIKEVNRSNMSKFVPMKSLVKRYGWENNVEALAAQECELLSNGKYENVKAEVVHHSWCDDDFHGEELVVFRNNFGKSKVVKHMAFYEEPNFEWCWI